MNTSTRVEFGLYDVTARSDSAPVTEDAKDFCNLSKDLLLESVPNQNKYARWKRGNGSWTAASCFFPKRLGVFLGLLEHGTVERKRCFCQSARAEYPLRQESQ